MATVTFDTHAAIEYLIKKGVKKEQAEAFVKITREAYDLNVTNLVTKDYLDAKLNATESKLDAKLNEVKFDILKWILPFLVGIILTIFFK